MHAAAQAAHPAFRPTRARVMIADDSVVVRGLVSRWVEEAGFEVVATAPDGRAALDVLESADPDIVLLDLDMPELDGIGALPLLLAKRPTLSVIVVSTLTRRNAALSLKCLSLGATDYLAKPETNRDLTTSACFRAELLAKLQALEGQHQRRARDLARACRQGLSAAPVRPSFTPALTLAAPRAHAIAPRYLLVGASTGGPRAIGQVLTALGPALQRVAVLVVQHMPPLFTTVFAEHLADQTGAPAREAQAGERLMPGRIYVAPGGRHMGLIREPGRIMVRLDDGPPVNRCRPAVDVLFLDAAATLGSACAAVVLSGMGSDGALGARALVEAGAAVLVQDEATSTVWGMPGSIARAGLAHAILPVSDIAPAIHALVGEGSP